MTNAKTILVIDDEEDTCQLIQNYFESKGHDVFVATNGEKGLLSIREYRPDVVFLDLRLKDISGIDLLKRLQQLAIFTRIVMISGVDDMEMMNISKSFDIEDYIVKPFDLEKLNEYV